MRLERNFEAGSASRLEMVDLRNRIAHHEPIVLRVRTTVTKTGASQPPLAILRNAADRLDSFEERVAASRSRNNPRTGRRNRHQQRSASNPHDARSRANFNHDVAEATRRTARSSKELVAGSHTPQSFPQPKVVPQFVARVCQTASYLLVDSVRNGVDATRQFENVLQNGGSWEQSRSTGAARSETPSFAVMRSGLHRRDPDMPFSRGFAAEQADAGTRTPDPSLRVIAPASAERMVEPNRTPNQPPCATRVPVRGGR
jgi:hypothetical protein